MPSIAEGAFTDTVKWYATVADKKDTPFLKKLEAVFLALVYNRYDAKTHKDFNWHIAMSDVHDPREAHLHKIFTNHSQIVYASSNIKQGEVSVSSEVNSTRPVRYH